MTALICKKLAMGAVVNFAKSPKIANQCYNPPMERKLASIQKILDIKPIEGADTIVCATVLGWHVVTRKDEFKVGDLCVYFEVDSLLPVTEDFAFLAKGRVKKSYFGGKEYEGYRLRTIKLRGQVSQGLCLPMSILTGKKYPNDAREVPVYDYKEGLDVSALLGVVKYEGAIPACLTGVVRGLFPSYIPKTDEIRLQAVPQILERHKAKRFYVTEKVDGTSMTVFLKDGELHVCSRGLDLLESDKNTYWQVVRALNLEEKLRTLAKPYALQGEVVGDHIQNNRLKINGHTSFFFNIYDIEKGKFLAYTDFMSTIKELDVPVVPLIDDNFTLLPTVDEMVVYATRKSVIADTEVEGVVIRSIEETQDEDLGRLSFKVINPEFLLKYGE